jgi:diguanylate cyclase (GGDEF)-like protein/PAS domain S-box-containing protein
VAANPPPVGVDWGSQSFGSRLKGQVLDPLLLAGLPVAAVFCLLRFGGLVAPTPYWVIVLIVFGAQAISLLAGAAWLNRPEGWRLTAYVGAVMGVIGIVAYSTGWGPILSLGFIFGAASILENLGSKATKPALIWTVVYMGIGQLAISTGVAPSLISQPRIDGLAVLCLFGVLLTIALLGRSTSAREHVESDLRHSARRFEALVRHASDIIIVVDEVGQLQYVSPAFERVLGKSRDEFGARPAVELMHPDDVAKMRSTPSGDQSDVDIGRRTELRMQHANGTWRWFEATVTDHLADPDVRGLVSNLHDITDRKHADEALREAHERFRSAFENAPIGMSMADLDGVILRANPAMGRILGRNAGDLPGQHIDAFTHHDDQDLSNTELARLVAGESESYRIEKRYCHADGHDVWTSLHVSCVRDNEGKPLYFIGQVEDVTESRALRERLAQAAIHDPLTSLPNRELFMDRLETSLHLASRDRHRVLVMFLDIDRFKLINDSLGHDVGDQILCAVADRLRSVMRASDTLARFGGDEFTILRPEDHDEKEALEAAERLVGAMADPIVLPSGEIFVSLSVGMALSSGDAVSAAMLLRNADVAMYQAKDRGPARIEIYREANESHVVSRLRTSNELHRALERDELELHYQPIVDLYTETLVGMEALVRWRHPTRGLLSPREFIPLAEDCGLISRVGAWVLKEACQQIAAWTTRCASTGRDDTHLNIAVNISALQLGEPGFPRLVAEVLDSSGILAGRLSLEITESALMRDPDDAILVLQTLRDLGLHLEIDDFGTGYSSLSYLQRIPVETLKIDRSFVEEMDHNSESVAIVRTIMGLGKSLGLSVIAEGVERTAEAARLKALGCHLAQGYLYGGPLPASALGYIPADDLSSWQDLLVFSAS